MWFTKQKQRKITIKQCNSKEQTMAKVGNNKDRSTIVRISINHFNQRSGQRGSRKIERDQVVWGKKGKLKPIRKDENPGRNVHFK